MKKKVVGIVIFIICIVFISNINDKNSFTIKSVSYNGDNLRISVDGVESKTLPTSGNYYLADYDCKSSNTKLKWDNVNYELDVSNGKKVSSVACYLDFQSQPLLSSMEVGSYVKYVGSNGCAGNSCKGENANYLNDNNMGYCDSDDYKFTTNGWRIGYVDNGSAYLVSAGAPECMCTGSDGKASTNSCSSYLSSDKVYKHIDNMNDVALKYCNTNYANGGICDNTTTWAMNANDFKKITGNELSPSSCNSKFSNKSCGYTNDLIDNGGNYRFATAYGDLTETVFYWRADYRGLFNSNSSYLYGVRPVIYLDSTVVVIGGSGTYEDPYLIDNNTFFINNGNDYVTDKSKVELSLIRSSEVSTMCISVETSGCTNYIKFSKSHNLDLSSEEDGEKTIYVYYKNSNNDVIASLRKDIVLDHIGPSDNSIKISDEDSLTRKLTLKSVGADYMCFSNTSDKVNECSKWEKYNSNYTWKLSDGDGTKIVYAFFKDKAGNVSSAVSDSVSYSRDCLEIDDIYAMDYTGEVVNSNGIDVKLCKGIYKLETWGAQGGNSGGAGGYSVGTINLTGAETLYFYVGGAGGKGVNAGFNGGGTTGTTGGAGGGATDIRVGQDSLYARVIVAGGGGGKGKDNCAIGGVGGGTTGGGTTSQNSCGTQAGGGTQTAGGIVGIYDDYIGANAGSFGIGGNAIDGIYDGGAGGGGWYGGGAGVSADWSNGGGGGSGFVYTSSSAVPNGYLVGSAYYLSEAFTLDGSQNTIPAVDGKGTETGHNSNGYIKITRLS